MKFIIGLGNPGLEYLDTRHNAGFAVLEALAENLVIATTGSAKFSLNKKLNSEIAKVNDLILAKPQTFMNNSGQAVRAILDYYAKGKLKNAHLNSNDQVAIGQKIDDLFVIHDDLDLQLGTYKIQLGKGPKAHNGLLSIYQHLGTDQFWHIKVGVDGRAQNNFMSGGDYVLNKFLPSEKDIMKETTAKIILELKKIINA